MGRHKLLKPAYIEPTAQVDDEVEIPDAEVQLYVDNGVIAGKKSEEPQTLGVELIELPEGDILSPMRSDPVSETEGARVVPEEERKSSRSSKK